MRELITFFMLLTAATHALRDRQHGETSEERQLSLLQRRAQLFTEPPGDAAEAQHSDGEGCIGSMCVGQYGRHDRQNDRTHAAALEGKHFHATSEKMKIMPVCYRHPPEKHRVLLTAVAHAYHGTTALEEIMMSSPQVATLCSCRSWQCETTWLPKLRNLTAWDWDYGEALDIFSECWDLSRHILFQKFILPNTCASEPAERGGPHCQTASLAHFEESMQKQQVPALMVQQGVEFAKRAYLLLWRPLCLALLSSHAQTTLKTHGPSHLAKKEIYFLKEMVRIHQYLLAHSTPALVVSLASLMWEPERNRLRIETFLPCLDSVDMSFVPKMGTDIFPENRFKAEGSMKAFGRSVDPYSLYDVKSGSCKDKSLLQSVRTQHREEADQATKYLRMYS